MIKYNEEDRVGGFDFKEHYASRVYRKLDVGEQLIMFGDPADSQDFCAAVAYSKNITIFQLYLTRSWSLHSLDMNLTILQSIFR